MTEKGAAPYVEEPRRLCLGNIHAETVAASAAAVLAPAQVDHVTKTAFGFVQGR